MRRNIGLICLTLALAGGTAAGQAPASGAAQTQPPQTPQSTAPIDLAGNWVAVVTEDWRWRMVTPPKGDYASLPLNPAGIKRAEAWTPEMDGQCEAYGMGGLLRMPTRLRISWQDAQTLKIESDAGTQTRLLHFSADAAEPTERSLQGFSRAEWLRPGRGGGFGVQGGGAGAGPVASGPAPTAGPPPVGGSLKATTTRLREGWLRKNGVAYSENAEVTEYFERFSVPNGDEWFTVTTIVHDPTYLTQDAVVSSHFKREVDGSKWSPSSCRQAS